MRCVVLLAAVAALMLEGCASAVLGTTQRVSVVTEPAGAECVLRGRPGGAQARIAATPGEVETSRDNYPLTVSCRSPGHVDYDEQVDPYEGRLVDFETKRRLVSAADLDIGATGVAVDAESATNYSIAQSVAMGVVVVPLLVLGMLLAPAAGLGGVAQALAAPTLLPSSYAYPAVIAVVLTPATFPSDEARTAYAAQGHARIDRVDRALQAQTTADCGMFSCERQRRGDRMYIAKQRDLLDAAMAKARVEPAAGLAAPQPAPSTGVPPGAVQAPP